ncbi:hypothetical protein [Streptomyces sp. SPB074]|uniref:hypothetical protein n=1 Tax=Streptomyces sp. (strain SPB074) TaxID=465543 RepID=UPI00017F1016|nr:hypothetical protein [Streptomyces sp. SPB074]
MIPRTWTSRRRALGGAGALTALTALTAVTLLAGAGLTGCATAKDATPEKKVFQTDGGTLNVRSHGVPTDLVPSERKDVEVTRWFAVGFGADAKSSWTLEKGVLDLRAGCSKFANCDVRYRVEVPKGMKVPRNGRGTDLKGTPDKAAGAPRRLTVPSGN